MFTVQVLSSEFGYRNVMMPAVPAVGTKIVFEVEDSTVFEYVSSVEFYCKLRPDVTDIYSTTDVFIITERR